MYLDLPTLIFSGSIVSVLSGGLLAFAWSRTRHVPALGLWALADLLAGLGVGLVGLGSEMPGPLLPIAAVTALTLSPAITLQAARSFNGRRIQKVIPLIGPALWLLFSAIAAYLPAGFPTAVSSSVSAIYAFATAVEIWRGRSEPLHSRWPSIVLSGIHGLVQTIPFLTQLAAGPMSVGILPSVASLFGILYFEGLFYPGGMAFFLIAMVKERAELEQRNLAAALTVAHRAAEDAQERASALARHDTLTGLPNRRVFSEEIEKAMGRVNRGLASYAVLMIDLDHFKPVNDLHGHATGDLVLREVANRLKEVCRKNDVVARLGGDEFAIVSEVKAKEESPANAALHLANRVIAAVGEPIRVTGLSLKVGASVGISLCPADGVDGETLLHAADIAMYRAKREAQGTYRFFEQSMDTDLRERAELETDLRRAVAEGQIQPYYQPIIDLAQNHMFGFELLARWPHPTKGMLQPDLFIPIAEELGIISDLTYGLLRAACQDAKSWPADFTLSINISPIQLKDLTLPAKLLAILTQGGFPPGRLEVEITESALVSDLASAKTILTSLQNLGVKIALDDFGTGYSSMYHLRELRFDKIKIDRSFIQSMRSNSESAKIVNAILGLTKSLGLSTTAEGIEDAELMLQMNEKGVEFGQGFYFGKPMPAAAAAALIQQESDLSPVTTRIAG